MQHYTTYFGLSDMIAIDQVTLQILVGFDTLLRHRDNLSSDAIDVIVAIPDDDAQVYFLLCDNPDRRDQLINGLPHCLCNFGNWQQAKQHSALFTKRSQDIEFAWNPVKGYKVDDQMELMWIRLAQLLFIAPTPLNRIGVDTKTVWSTSNSRHGHKVYHKLFPKKSA